MRRQNNGSQLPFELLAHIFLHSRPELTNIGLVIPEDPLPYLITISSVCQWWRQVAIESQSLWTIVFLDLCTLATPPSRSKYEMMLERSGDMDLGIFVTGVPVFMRDSDFTELRIPFVVVRRMLRRAEVLRFQKGSFDNFPPLTSVNVPRLKHLVLDTRFALRTGEFLQPPKAIGSLSYKIDNHFNLEDRNFIKEASPMFLEIDVLYFDGDWVAMLETLSHLQELSVTHRGPPITRPLSHQALTHLTLTGSFASPTCSRLGALPNLTQLTLCATRFYPERSKDDGPCNLPMLPALQRLTIKPKLPEYNRHAQHTAYIVHRGLGFAALEQWDESALAVVSRLVGLPTEAETECESRDGYAPSSHRAPHPSHTPSPASAADATLVLTRIHKSLQVIRIGLLGHNGLEWLRPTSGACVQLMERRPDVRIDWADENKEGVYVDWNVANRLDGSGSDVSGWVALSDLYSGVKRTSLDVHIADAASGSYVSLQ